jgi:hypothetical protein
MNLSSKTILIPSIVLLIGTVFGTTTATNAFADDPFKNNVDIKTHSTNSCDESEAGLNDADCEISKSFTTDTITVNGDQNKVSVDQKTKNDCDESGDGDNTSFCSITDSIDIGPIDLPPPP